MVQFIERPAGFGEQIGKSLGKGLANFAGGALAGVEERKENEALKELTGQNYSGLSPDIKRMMLQGFMKQQGQKKETRSTFESILDEMEGLKQNVGYKIEALSPWSETSGKRSQINTLRLSLEGLFRDLTLKGQFPKAIYERILKELPSASDTETQYLNKIQAVRKMLESHYGDQEPAQKTKGQETVSSEKGISSEKTEKMKFDPNNPEHQKKAKQLHNKYKDLEKVRELLKKEFEGVDVS